MKLENEITVEVLETKENVIKSISGNGFKLLKEYDINDIYLVKKEFENCKISPKDINDENIKEYIIKLKYYDI